MKHLILVLFLMLQVAFAKAQNYVPFPDSNAVWNEIFIYGPFGPNAGFFYNYTYGLLGDTIINSIQYHKIYYSPSDTLINSSNSSYNCAIREDVSKKIYFIQNGDSTEYLLYDFSKNVGDTITIDLIGFNYIISTIDSVFIDNQYRRRFNFSQGLYPYWIEGIGSPRGLFSPVIPQPLNGDSWELVCFKQDDILIHRNLNYNNCSPLIGNIEKNFIKKNNSIKIYPNPASYQSINLEYELNQSEEIEISIFDNFGKIIKEINNIPSGFGKHTVEIDISGLPSGLYLCRLKSGNGHVVAKFSVVE